MQVEIVESGLEALRPEWDRLFASDPTATPFVSSAWAEAWLKHWDPAAQPWIVTVRDGNDLVGLAPLVARTKGPLRALRVLGKEPGDYWSPLATPEARDEVLRLLVSELSSRGHDWDLLYIDCLREGSPLEPALKQGLRVHRRPPTRCPGIVLPDSFDDYLSRLPSKRRNNMRRHLKKLDDGNLELSSVTDLGQLPETMTRWHALRLSQWDGRDKEMDPDHQTGRFLDFMLAAATRLVPAGQAVVWEFRLDGQVIGAWFHLVDDQTFYWYLGGFDPSHSSLGLGKICVLEGIRSSIAAGRTYFDFTRGEEPFKYQYAAVDRLSPDLVLGHRGPRSAAALRVVAARDALKSAARSNRTLRRVTRRGEAQLKPSAGDGELVTP